MEQNTVREQLLEAVTEFEDTSFESLHAEVSALESTHKLVHARFLEAGESD